MNKDVFSIHADGTSTVRFSGRFDAAQAEKSRTSLEGLHGSLVLDFTDLDYISSAGLSVLLVTLKRLEDEGHTLKLRNLRERIVNVFRYAGLDRVFTIE